MRSDFWNYDHKNFKIDRFMYKGVAYGIGTKVLVENVFGLQEATFVGWTKDEGFVGENYRNSFRTDDCSFIIKIIEPVYYVEKEEPKGKPCSIWTRTGSGSWNSHNEVCVGLVIYILVMIVGAIFNARILIWIMATIIFFGWKAKK